MRRHEVLVMEIPYIHWVSLAKPLTAMLKTSAAMSAFCIFILVLSGTQCLMKSCWLKLTKVENNKHGLLTLSTVHINVVAPQDNTLNARNRSCTILHTRACYFNCVCSLINPFKSTFSLVFYKIYVHCSLVTITKSKIWLQVTGMFYQTNIELFFYRFQQMYKCNGS